ncbi:MAG TPA: GntR family transcriptional regulator, partial [Anaerolineae bacterium]|nr:GntR family transcriptional regulator [Anaerolineae bacterium]
VGGPSSLKERAYIALKSAILSLDLKPGQALVESDLAEQLGVSKTPVRDALQELEREGFVVRVPYKGTYVAQVNWKDIEEIFQLRAVLEGLAVRLATLRLTADDWEKGERLLARAQEALAQGDRELCSRLGRQFHKLFIRKADNQRLASIMYNLEDHLQRFRRMSDQIGGRLEKSQEEHRRVLEAVKQRNALLAEEAMRSHMHSVLRDLSEEQPHEG